jgi:hypothetical protein
VLVAVVASLLPNNAAASCGDWLAHPSQKVEHRQIPGDGSRCPCEDGECRSDRSQLPFAPPAVPKLSTDRSACLDRTIGVSDGKSERLVAESRIVELKFVPFALERPPRV